MISFLLAITLLIAGYCIYGRYVEKVFGAKSSRKTPSKRMEDGVDYKELPKWRIFVIQFLNIAGLGPIFGAILGAAYGPVAYLWIVLGCIFMGAVHDYFSGMIATRRDGMSLPNIIGKYLGRPVQMIMIAVVSLLVLLTGASFVNGPADLLHQLTDIPLVYWLGIIFCYYFIATILPIDKLIGRIYPYLGIFLFIMVLMVGFALLFNGATGNIHIPELTIDSFRNYHANPERFRLFPMLFVVISCGAISGFHATQSTLMSRCIGDEKEGRPIFYGAMIAEGIVALIWATAAMSYFGGAEGLNAAAASGMTPAVIVEKICSSWLGKVGAVIAIIGVVVCPITSGDTALRSLRLIIADNLYLNQEPIRNRLFIAIPCFIVAFLISRSDFSTIWSFVGITNQILASITLWSCAVYVATKHRNHWILSLPAFLLTFICGNFVMVAPHASGGLELAPVWGFITGSVIAATAMTLFLIRIQITRQKYYELPGRS